MRQLGSVTTEEGNEQGKPAGLRRPDERLIRMLQGENSRLG